MTGHEFDLVGGDPALDFLNTIHDWTVAEPRDYIPDYGEALRFAVAAGVLTRAEASRLASRPSEAEMRELRELRARLERIFRAAVTAQRPSAADVDALARDAADAARSVRLRPAARQLVRTIDVDLAGAATLRWRVVDAAVNLLTSERLARGKTCPSCGWFFLDTSKNRSRRWCSMSTCGTSAKSRSYYWRIKRRSRPKNGTTLKTA